MRFFERKGRSIPLLLALILASLFFCQCSVDSEKSLDDNAFIIDLDSVGTTDDILYSEHFSNVKLVFLETTDECIVGNIDQLRTHDDLYYVLDRSFKSLLVFNEKGKFLRKIGKVGRGPGEYTSPRSFRIDEKNKKIYVLDYISRKLIIYDFDGKFLNDITLNSPYFNDFCLINDTGILHALDLLRTLDDEYLLHNFDFNGGKIASYFPSSKYGKSWNLSLGTDESFFVNENIYRFYEPFLDTVYSFDNGIPSAYIVLSSENIMKKSDYMGLSANDPTMIPDKIIGPMNFIENNQIVILTMWKNRLPTLIFIQKYNGKAKMIQRYNNYIDDLAGTNPQSPLFKAVTENDEFVKVVHSRELGWLRESLASSDDYGLLEEEDRNRLLNTTDQEDPVLFLYKSK